MHGAAGVGPEYSVVWALLGIGCYRPVLSVTGEDATVVV